MKTCDCPISNFTPPTKAGVRYCVDHPESVIDALIKVATPVVDTIVDTVAESGGGVLDTIKAWASKLFAAATDVVSLSTRVDNVAADVARLSTNVGNLSSLSADVAGLKTAQGDEDAMHASMMADLTALKAAVAGLTASVAMPPMPPAAAPPVG